MSNRHFGGMVSGGDLRPGNPSAVPGADELAGKTIRLLLAEDDDSDAELVVRTLRRDGFKLDYERVAGAAAMAAALERQVWDVVISDYNMPGFSGMDALRIVLAAERDIPFILISGTVGEEVAVDALKAGADDYVLKGNLSRLPYVLERALRAAAIRAGHRRAQGELTASEAHFRGLFDWAAVGIVYSDPDGRCVDVNPKFCDISGYTREEALQLGVRELTHPDDFAASIEARTGLVSGASRSYEREERLVRKDQAWIWAQITTTVARTSADGTRHFLSIIRDVSARRRADQVLALEHGVARQLADADSASMGMQAVLRLVCESEGWDFGRYWRVDEAAGVLRFGDAWSVPGSEAGAVTEKLRDIVFAPGDGLAGKVWQSGEPLWVSNVSEDARAMRMGPLVATSQRGVFVFPVIAEARTIGVLAFVSNEIRQPDERLLVAVRVIGGQIGQFLRRVESAERIKRLSRVHAVLSGINALIVRVHDRDELFREACRIAVDAGGFKLAWLGVFEPQAMRVKVEAWHGAGEGYIDMMPLELTQMQGGGRGLAGQVLIERKAIVADDMTQDARVLLRKESLERGFHSLAILPLLVAGEAIGILALYAGEVKFFDDEEMKLLHELAGDIGFALDHIEKASRLDYLAYYDALTGLANRSLFQERLAQHIHAAENAKHKVAVVIADIERFRMINDSLGRQAGDALLKQVAGRLARSVDPAGIARIGADHFAIVLPEMKGRSEIGRIVEDIWRSCLDEPFKLEETEIRVTLKGGISLFPGDGHSADSLFRKAEAAWKNAKQKGERFLFHSQEMTARISESLTFENELRMALEKEQFVLHYQPKVELDSRRIVGVEALIRWQSPERGLVPPGLFIPLLEETGLILNVGAWALRRAARDRGELMLLGVPAPRIAVNVSQIQMRQRDFVDAVREAIAEDPEPAGIDLEITESLLMEDVAGNVTKLKAIADLGLKIAIDDFGTGYSSLGYLAQLPVHTLKIDRSFIMKMLNDPNAMTLVQTIISLAHSLRLSVVAEGVETEDQAKMLRLLRCDEMQGYLFSRPVPLEQIAALLAAKAKP